MRSLMALLALLVLAGAPRAAHAADPAAPAPAPTTSADAAVCAAGDAPDCPKVKVELGARAGYALPIGSALDGTKLSSMTDGQVPLWVDAGLRVGSHWFFGAYGNVGYAIPTGSACPTGASCSGSDVRVGLEAQYRFLAAPRLEPWIGVGAGYEWLHLSESLGRESLDATLHGFELFNVQAGADYRLCKGISVGPFAALSVGEYTNESVSFSSGDGSSSRSSTIDNTALHEWLTLGVRGRFDL